MCGKKAVLASLELIVVGIFIAIYFSLLSDPPTYPVYPLNSTGQYYYFPKLGEKNVTFEETRTACPHGYKLAGLETTNVAFLKMTKDLVDAAESAAVWTAGYIAFTAEPSGVNIRFVTWNNGKDSSTDVKTVNYLYHRQQYWHTVGWRLTEIGLRRTHMPIIRTKEQPLYLTLSHTDILYPQDLLTYVGALQPLCIRNVSDPYLVDEQSGQIFVPKFFTDYPLLLDRVSKVFNNMADRLKCLANKGSCSRGETSKTHEEAIGVRSYVLNESPYIAGFSQSVDLKTALTICAMMRYGSADSSNQAQFLTFDLLNDTGSASRDLTSNLKESIEFLMSYKKKLANIGDELHLNGNYFIDGGRNMVEIAGPMSVFIPTAGYLDLSNVFNETFFDTIVLTWKYSDGLSRKIADWNQTKAGEVKFASGIGWCVNNPGGITEFEYQIKFFSSFAFPRPRDWLLPNKVPIGIRGSNVNDSTPCLFAAFDEFMAPSSADWIPTCQLSP